MSSISLCEWRGKWEASLLVHVMFQKPRNRHIIQILALIVLLPSSLLIPFSFSQSPILFPFIISPRPLLPTVVCRRYIPKVNDPTKINFVKPPISIWCKDSLKKWHQNYCTKFVFQYIYIFIISLVVSDVFEVGRSEPPERKRAWGFYVSGTSDI